MPCLLQCLSSGYFLTCSISLCVIIPFISKTASYQGGWLGGWAPYTQARVAVMVLVCGCVVWSITEWSSFLCFIPWCSASLPAHRRHKVDWWCSHLLQPWSWSNIWFFFFFFILSCQYNFLYLSFFWRFQNQWFETCFIIWYNIPALKYIPAIWVGTLFSCWKKSISHPSPPSGLIMFLLVSLYDLSGGASAVIWKKS